MPKHVRPAKVVAIIDRKGGGGKTTIMHNLTAGFVLDGSEALAIEIDDNTRLRAILAGLEDEDDQELDALQTSYGLFATPENGTDRCSFVVNVDRLWEDVPSLSMNTVHDVRSQRGWTFPGRFDYIPGSEQVKDIEEEFATRALKESGFVPDVQLTQALTQARQQYDVIVMDSPPSLTRILRNILAASTHVIVVVEFDFASVEDYRRTIKAYRKICTVLRANKFTVPQAYVVLNKFKANNKDHQNLLHAYTAEHTETIKGQVVSRPAIIKEPILGVIPFDYDLLNSSAQINRSVHQYAPKSELGEAFYQFVQRTEQAIGLE